MSRDINDDFQKFVKYIEEYNLNDVLQKDSFKN